MGSTVWEGRGRDLQLHQALVSGGDTGSLQVYEAQLVLGRGWVGSENGGGGWARGKRSDSVTGSLDGELAYWLTDWPTD